MLQLAQKVHTEKIAIAKQLDHLKDKQRAFKSKLAASEDKNERAQLQAEADKEIIEKYQSALKKKSFELDEMKLAIEGFQEGMNNVT